MDKERLEGVLMRQDIEQALARFEGSTFGFKKNIEQLEQKLLETEEVKFIAPTNAVITTVGTRSIEKLPGVFALTNQRILFAQKAFSVHSFIVFDLSEVHMVSCRGNGLTGGHVEINTLVKTFDILVKYKKEIIQRIQQTFDETLAQYKQAKSSTPTSQSNDIPGQIQKLAGLREKGILTDDEFLAKKAELLARM